MQISSFSRQFKHLFTCSFQAIFQENLTLVINFLNILFGVTNLNLESNAESFTSKTLDSEIFVMLEWINLEKWVGTGLALLAENYISGILIWSFCDIYFWDVGNVNLLFINMHNPNVNNGVDSSITNDYWLYSLVSRPIREWRAIARAHAHTRHTLFSCAIIARLNFV